MKLVRYGQPGEEKPGLIDQNGTIRDLSTQIHDWDHTTLVPATMNAVRDLDWSALPRLMRRRAWEHRSTDPGRSLVVR